MFNKKIFLIIVLLAALSIVPATKIFAQQFYIGLNISSISGAPGASGVADKYWCLPGGSGTSGTRMTVTTFPTCKNIKISCLYDTTYLSAPACAGDTIWSGLETLEDGSVYEVDLHAPNFCPGYMGSDGNCFVADAAGENCCDVCGHYGMTTKGGEANCATNTTDCVSNTSADDSHCTIESTLMGANCSGGCTKGSSFSYYSLADNSCYTTYGGGPSFVSCSAPLANLNRVCSCNTFSGTPSTASFSFPFTAHF
jgi:hypothetical protein